MNPLEGKRRLALQSLQLFYNFLYSNTYNKIRQAMVPPSSEIGVSYLFYYH